MDKNAKPSKSDTAYIEIRRIITEFTLMPGQSICIKQLSDFLNFSTTPLREALFALEKDGYVARNRKDSFHVTNIDGDYIRSLFEYGRILYANANSDCCRPENHGPDNRANPLRKGHAATFSIDRLYQQAQDNTRNYFVRSQMGVFRIKAKSIRTALLYSDKEIFLSIYGKSDTSEVLELDYNSFFEKIHLRKHKLAEEIARSVLSYAVVKKLSCESKYGENTIKDFIE